jgi:hypothetical protein
MTHGASSLATCQVEPRSTASWVVLPLVALLAACSPAGGNALNGNAAALGNGGGSNGGGSNGAGSSGPNLINLISSDGAVSSNPSGGCTNLQCQQHQCPGGGSTTISGKVFDPAAKNPLYNIVVYIPNDALQPLPSGASCDTCNDLYSGTPIATTLTDTTGSFKLEDVPDGQNIPIVVQVGKWRMETTIPSVTACQDNPQPDGSLRLPRNHNEGNIPNIAISTGGADTLECLLVRVGIQEDEYIGGPGGPGRIHIFQGSGTAGNILAFFTGGAFGAAPNTSPAAPGSSSALWNTSQSLMGYDIVLLSCEGGETANMNQQALHDYASAGGRVFASHFHYSWFNSGPYAAENLATWTPGANSIGNINGNIVTTLANGQVFPKGQALQQWLGNVGALTNGELPIQQAKDNAKVSATNTPSQPWIIADQQAQDPGTTQYFSFNTPTNAAPSNGDTNAQCGRVVYSDLHVGAASGDKPGTVPTECAVANLSPQEKALEFMLFDLSSCVTPDNAPPPPPPPPQRIH